MAVDTESQVKVEFNEAGSFRIDYFGRRGPWADYRGIAHIEVSGQVYIAVSEYFAGTCGLEPETVYAASPCE